MISGGYQSSTKELVTHKFDAKYLHNNKIKGKE